MAQAALRVEQQKDNLCGPFCAARILGVEQDLVAWRAGSTLPPAGGVPGVPRGAESRTDYTRELPVVHADESGTSAAGLARAIEMLSGGALVCVPLRGRWTAERVARLVDASPAYGARLIANLRTGRLWGSRPRAAKLMAELDGEEVAGPPPDWDTGHYVELATLVRGRKGSLVVVSDTYPMLGLDGLHLQPPRALSAALNRGDGREGGVLAVVKPDGADGVRSLATEIGLEVGLWDNGSRSDAHGDR